MSQSIQKRDEGTSFLYRDKESVAMLRSVFSIAHEMFRSMIRNASQQWTIFAQYYVVVYVAADFPYFSHLFFIIIIAFQQPAAIPYIHTSSCLFACVPEIILSFFLTTEYM